MKSDSERGVNHKETLRSKAIYRKGGVHREKAVRDHSENSKSMIGGKKEEEYLSETKKGEWGKIKNDRTYR